MYQAAERVEQTRHHDNLMLTGSFTIPNKEPFKQGERMPIRKPQDNLRVEGEFAKRDQETYKTSERVVQKKPQDNLTIEKGKMFMPNKQNYLPGSAYPQKRPKDNLQLAGNIDFSANEKQARLSHTVVANNGESVSWEVAKENNKKFEPVKISEKRTSAILAQVNGEAGRTVTEESKTIKSTAKIMIVKETHKKGAENRIETTSEIISAAESEPIISQSVTYKPGPPISEQDMKNIQKKLQSSQVTSESYTTSAKSEQVNSLHKSSFEISDAKTSTSKNLAEKNFLNSNSTRRDEISQTRANSSSNISQIFESSNEQKVNSGSFRKRCDTYTKNGSQSSLAESLGGRQTSRKNSSSIRLGDYQNTIHSSTKANSSSMQTSSTATKKESLMSSADVQNSILHRKSTTLHNDITPSLSATATIQRKSLSNLHESHISSTAMSNERKSLSTQHRLGKQSTIKDALFIIGENTQVKKQRDIQVVQTTECKLHPIATVRKNNFSSITFSDFGTVSKSTDIRASIGRKSNKKLGN